MKPIVIYYQSYETPMEKRAVNLLSSYLLDYTLDYPLVFPEEQAYPGECHEIHLAHGVEALGLTTPEEYLIRVVDGVSYIWGYDQAGLLYGVVDYITRVIAASEYPDDDRYRVNPFESPLPDRELRSAPAVKERGIWTWGHVIYDYRRFIDNMVRMKFNTLILWNDHAPVNARDMVEYAHGANVKIFWGFAWLWDTKCAEVDPETVFDHSAEILALYEKEYLPLGGDGIYFQSFTEVNTETIGNYLIADLVTRFVNATAALFYEKYPDIELQFGLHAESVRNRLPYLAQVDPRIRIVWENCGSFPFDYVPKRIENHVETQTFVREIARLRGGNEFFGVVSKGLTKLDWRAFHHIEGPIALGHSSDWMMENRVERKRKIWRYLQAYWIANGDKALEMFRTLQDAKDGDLMITSLIEDGLFEAKIPFPAALYAEMVWDTHGELSEILPRVALRSDVEFM